MTQPITQLPCARVITGTAAEQELHAMGLTPSNLAQPCIEGLQSAVTSYSPFEPVIAFGISVWSKIVGALRKQLNEKGWEHHDIANAPDRSGQTEPWQSQQSAATHKLLTRTATRAMHAPKAPDSPMRSKTTQ